MAQFLEVKNRGLKDEKKNPKNDCFIYVYNNELLCGVPKNSKEIF